MEWHVWDFPDSIYVKFKDEYRIKLFERLRKHFGGYRKISKLGFEYTFIATCLKRGYDSGGYQAYTNVRIIKRILELFPEEKEIIENNTTSYRCRAGWPVYDAVLPIRETPELYSIACHMIADGSAGTGKTPYYSNSRKELLNEFERKLQTFGKVETNSYINKRNGVTFLMFPKAITDILSRILDIRFTFPDRLPKRLFESSDECKIAAIRAVFDDEGTVSTMFSISQNSENILLQVKKLLSFFGIKTGNICCSGVNHDLNVLISSYEKFYNIVGLTSLDKIDNLAEDVKVHRNYVESLLKTKIYNMLINNHPLNKHQIAKKFNITSGNVNCTLKLLENDRKVKRKFVGNNKPLLWYPELGT
jgi:hypothetical protein